MSEYFHELFGYGSLFLTIAVIITIAAICHYAFRKALTGLEKQGQLADSTIALTKNIGRWLIILFAILFILQQFGVPVSTIISSLLAVAAMIAIGFIAVWSVLSNFLCSLLLIIFRPFQVGDEIEITEPVGGSSLRGKVLKFNVMYTSLLEKVGDEEIVTSIPNNIFFQKAVRRRHGSNES